MSKVKPCPFCGEPENGDHPPKAVEIGGHVFGHHYAVVCENCGSIGCPERVRIKVDVGMKEAIEKAKEEAIFLWNRRVESKQIDEMGEHYGE